MAEPTLQTIERTKEQLLEELRTLREREAQAHDLLDSTSELIQSVAPDGSLLYVNRAWRDVLGYAKDDVRHLPWLKVIHPDSHAHCQELFSRVMAGERIPHLEATLITKQGKTVVVEGTSHCQFKDGKPRAVLGVFCVVTQRKQVEDALKFSVEGTATLIGSEFFRSLARHLALMLEVHVVFIAELMPKEKTKARTLALWIEGGIAKNIDYSLKGTPCEQVVAQGLSCYPDNVQARFPQDRWLVEVGAESYAAIPFYDSSGKVVGHMGILDTRPFRDVSFIVAILRAFAARVGAELQRKRAEEKLRATYEYLDSILLNMPAGVAILEGPDFRYFRINHTLADINGLSVEDHLGRPLAEVLPDAAQDIVPRLRSVLETAEPALNHEFSTRLPKDHDKIRHFMDSFFPIMDRDGKPMAVGAVVLEITDRKQAEEQLQNYRDHLEELVEERTAELATANRALKGEIAQRKRTERTLQQKNIALREVLSQIELEKKDIKGQVIDNVDTLLLPLLAKLKRKGTSIEERYLEVLERNLKELTEPFGRHLGRKLLSLTPRQIEICNMLKIGLTSKELSRFLNLSPLTVEAHRNAIRKKLGLRRKDTNLTTYLQSFST